MADNDKIKDNKNLTKEEFSFVRDFFISRYNLTKLYEGRLSFSIEDLQKRGLPNHIKKAANYSIYGNNEELYIFINDSKFHSHYFICLDTIVLIDGVDAYFDRNLLTRTVTPVGNNLTFTYTKPNITILTSAELEAKNYNDLRGIKIFKEEDNRPVRILSCYNLYPIIYKFSTDNLMAENFEILDKSRFSSLEYRFPSISINDPLVIIFNAFIGDLIKADVIYRDVSINSGTSIREVSVIDNIYYIFGKFMEVNKETSTVS